MTTMAHTYPYPRPGLTVDAAIVATGTTPPKLLLIQRKHDPFAGAWALPGGFVDELEPLDVAAARELQEETSINPSTVGLMKQIGTFGDPGRDPRGWTVTVAYAALVPSADLGVKAADDAAEAEWYDVEELPALAFDHKLVVRRAFEELAKEEVVQKDAELAEALRRAAHKLQGPWR